MIAKGDTPALPHLLDAAAVVVCGLDPEGHIVAANERCVHLAGMGDALLGRDWRELFTCPDRHEHVASLWKSVTPERASDSIECVCRSGRPLRWRFSHWSIDGASALCAVGVDVSDERERQARRRTRERVTALANLGAGLAHELRNPLNSANLQLALAERKLARATGLAPVETHVGHAIREIGRAAELLDDFLAFARPQPLTIEVSEIDEIAERAIAQVTARATDAGVTVTLQGSPVVRAELDPERIEAALVQLLANAIDACASAPVRAVSLGWRAAADTVIVEVADRGPGLPSEDAPVFDPFFTTKPEGTGLGLAIVERAVADHGGVVEVERVDDSTVFRMHLPLLAGAI